MDNERTQTKEITKFSGRILIREIDPETSHIDYLAVTLSYSDGTRQLLLPTLASLRAIDGNYLLTNQGDEVTVDFEPPTSWDFTKAEVSAHGYYVTYTNSGLGKVSSSK